ncbi:hypothetical protein FRC01_011095, partial [Tulasnella sp. 417]
MTWEVLGSEPENLAFSMTYRTKGQLVAENLAAVTDVLQPDLLEIHIRTRLQINNSGIKTLGYRTVLTELHRLPKVSQIQFGDAHPFSSEVLDGDEELLISAIQPLFPYLHELLFYYQSLEFILRAVRTLITSQRATVPEDEQPPVKVYVRTEPEMEAISSGIYELEDIVGREGFLVQV